VAEKGVHYKKGRSRNHQTKRKGNTLAKGTFLGKGREKKAKGEAKRKKIPAKVKKHDQGNRKLMLQKPPHIQEINGDKRPLQKSRRAREKKIVKTKKNVDRKEQGKGMRQKKTNVKGIEKKPRKENGREKGLGDGYT